MSAATICLFSILFGCKNDAPPTATFAMPDSMHISCEEDSFEYRLTSNVPWSIYTNNSTWVTASPSYGKANTDTIVKIKVSENKSYTTRKLVFNLHYGESSEHKRQLIIEQERNGEHLLPLKKEYTVPADEVRLFAGFESNIPFEVVSYPDWMRYDTIYTQRYPEQCDPMAAYSSCQMVKADSTIGVVYPLFTFTPNVDDTAPRTGTIRVQWKESSNVFSEMTVTQSGVGSEYFYIERTSAPYVVIAAEGGSTPVVVRSTFSQFDWSLKDKTGEDITWATLQPITTRAAVPSYTYTLQFDPNTSGEERGAVLRMWPKDKEELAHEVSYLQYK